MTTKPEKKTAIAIAAMRCLATTALPPGRQYDARALDHEWHFLDTTARAIVSTTNFLNRHAFQVLTRLMPDGWGGLTFNLCRMQHMDHWLQLALSSSSEEGSCQQVVFLGVGADCRATRYASNFQAAHAKAYEVDLPGMIQYKKDVVLRCIAGSENRHQKPTIDNIDHIEYIECNFEETAVDELLIQSTSYDATKKSLILWEGVTYYLTGEAIDNSMKAISNLLSTGGLFTFDFLLKSVVDGTNTDPKAKAMMDTFKDTEPLLWGLDPSQLSDFLTHYDFELLEYDDPAKLQQKYMMVDGKEFLKVKEFFHLVVAREK